MFSRKASLRLRRDSSSFRLRTVSDETGRNTTLLESKVIVGKLNRMMRGWANYFCLGPVSKAYHTIDEHARRRFRLPTFHG